MSTDELNQTKNEGKGFVEIDRPKIDSSMHEFIGKIEVIEFPDEYTFPYIPEVYGDDEISEEEAREILSRFFTNVDGPVYALKNMDSEIAGALLSKFSRMKGSVRKVFLNEFIKKKEAGFDYIVQHLVNEEEMSLEKAKQRTKAFYDKVFGEYGDDSVIQMASVYICFEGVSQIAAKEIEDGRIASSFIEKSTRYVSFDNKVNDHYLYMESPEIMKSEFGEEYLQWNNSLFEAYSKNVKIAFNVLKGKYPIESLQFRDDRTGEEVFFDSLDEVGKDAAKEAYTRAIRAKALDAVRSFLPTTTVTNLGAHLSGQAAESMINKMLSSQHSEVRMLGLLAYQELFKVSPNVLSKIDDKHGVSSREYLRALNSVKVEIPEDMMNEFEEYEKKELDKDYTVRLVDSTSDAELNVAAALLIKHPRLQGWPIESVREVLKRVKEKEQKDGGVLGYSEKVVSLIQSAVPERKNRRNKLPRAFEHAFAWFDMAGDWGIFRDLQRNRMNTILRQYLSAEEIIIPDELEWEGMEEVREDYLRLGGLTRDFHNRLKESKDQKVRDAAEYVTLFGNKVRFSFAANLRQWAFFSELRTISGGHPSYRKLVQDAATLLLENMPWMQQFMTHINWTKDVKLGRLTAEVRTAKKRRKNKKGATKDPS